MTPAASMLFAYLKWAAADTVISSSRVHGTAYVL